MLFLKIQFIKAEHKLPEFYPRTPVFQVGIIHLRLNVFAITTKQKL